MSTEKTGNRKEERGKREIRSERLEVSRAFTGMLALRLLSC
jgi:hypothetical protein